MNATTPTTTPHLTTRTRTLQGGETAFNGEVFNRLVEAVEFRLNQAWGWFPMYLHGTWINPAGGDIARWRIRFRQVGQANPTPAVFGTRRELDLAISRLGDEYLEPYNRGSIEGNYF